MKNIRKMIALALLAAITGSLSAANYIIKNETDKTIYVNINKRMKKEPKLQRQQAKYLKRFKYKINAGKSKSIKRGGRDVHKIQVYISALKLNAYYEGKVDIRRKGKDKTLIVKINKDEDRILLSGSGSKGLKCKTRTSSRITKRPKKRKLIGARDQELIRDRDQSRKVIRARK